MYLNKVMLIGRVGAKPEVRYIKEDTPTASFRMATTENYKTKEGERREITEWHNIVAWRQLAKNVESYIDKGMLVYVEGRLQTRSWQGQDNQTHYTTEIIADVIRMLEPKSARDGQPASSQTAQHTNFQPAASQQQQPQQPTTQQDSFTPAPVDDDLPF